jgi:hypothetical protein
MKGAGKGGTSKPANWKNGQDKPFYLGLRAGFEQQPDEKPTTSLHARSSDYSEEAIFFPRSERIRRCALF